MNLNKIIIIGTLIEKKELVESGNTQILNFTVVTNRSYKNSEGEKVEEAEFHKVVAFGHTAKFVNNYADKGNLVSVEGRVQTRAWEKDGVKRYNTEVIAENVELQPKNLKKVETEEEEF